MKDERMKNELNKYRKRNLLIKKKTTVYSLFESILKDDLEQKQKLFLYFFSTGTADANRNELK